MRTRRGEPRVISVMRAEAPASEPDQQAERGQFAGEVAFAHLGHRLAGISRVYSGPAYRALGLRRLGWIVNLVAPVKV